MNARIPAGASRRGKDPNMPTQSQLFGPAPDHHLVTHYRYFWYGLSFFVPFVGMVLALFLYDQDHREVRKVGRNCLMISFLVWVVFPLLALFFLLLVGAALLANFVSDFVAPTD
jgi:hypothetical protein